MAIWNPAFPSARSDERKRRQPSREKAPQHQWGEPPHPELVIDMDASWDQWLAVYREVSRREAERTEEEQS